MSRAAYVLPVTLSLVIGWNPAAISAEEPAGGNVASAGLEAWAGSSERELALLERYCIECHNSSDWAGGVAFDVLALEELDHDAAIWEEAIRKIRAGLMPPQGEPRPERAVLDGMVQWLGAGLDQAWDVSPNPGAEPVSRLNRTEYGNAVRDLLAFDAEELVRTLPADATAAGFDNISQALSMSPTLLEGYLSVARQISRQAVGDMATAPTQVEYQTGGGNTQQAYVEGLPLGTRGGLEVEHYFPVDAEYEFKVAANIPVAGRGNDTGRMIWCGGPTVEVMFNGVPLPVEDPQRFRLQVPAGPHSISLALLDEQRCIGAGELYLAEVSGQAGSIQGLEIDGPYNISGPGDTPSRRAIFVCQPAQRAEEQACARQILSKLATRAYRRPLGVESPAVDTLMRFYEMSRSADGGDFESGIEGALTWLLVDPRFLYQFEEEPEGLAAGEAYRISDLELASRLSFFLWSSIPDEPLLNLAAEGKLSEGDVLAQEVLRMLADPRAEALVENFVGQWLKLRELEEVAPQDAAFDPALRQAMRLETLHFFQSLVREDKNLLGLLDSDYTYLNERLATHYGIDGVWGGYMRRVELPGDSPRHGLLGHGSILTATSAPDRTSPVIRGTWVVENLLGAHVPSPPPGVETNLDPAAPGQNVQADTLRQRLELHRSDPACASCHTIMDPIGFSLENFDLVGRWRTVENGLPINTVSEMVDGTYVDGPAALRAALLARPEAFMASISERLLTYALGRELEHYDGPAVRRIVERAVSEGFTLTALVQAVVMSAPFQQRSKLAEEVPTTAQLSPSRD
jgi:mono/diheme cytochrome c family protein